MQRVWVWLWVSITMAFDRSTQWFEEKTCSSRAEDPRSPFFRARRCLRRQWSKVLPVWPMLVLCHSAHGMLSFPAIGWYWILGVHRLLPQGPVGTEGNLDG